MIKFRWNGMGHMKATLDKIIGEIENKAISAGDEGAQILVDDVRSHWSAIAPSVAGSAPAIDTGNLDSASVVEHRDVKGRFASAGTATMTAVRWNAAEGNKYHGRGDYAPILEDGSMYMDARPFFRPAIQRVTPIIMAMIKKRVL